MAKHRGLELSTRDVNSPLSFQSVVETLETTTAASYQWVLLFVDLQADLGDRRVADLMDEVNSGPRAYRTNLDELRKIGEATQVLYEVLFAGSPTLVPTERERATNNRGQFAVVVYGLEGFLWEVFAEQQDVVRKLEARFAAEPTVKIGSPRVDIEGEPINDQR